MSHEKKISDGKRKKEPKKSLKEKRKEKKAKHEEAIQDRKPQNHLLEKISK